MPKPLSKEDFYKSLELAPRLTVELLIEDPSGRLLLTTREEPPFIGYWHVPGGFLIKDELIEDCAKRLLLREIGLELGVEGVFVGRLFEAINQDVREGVSAHIVHYPIRYKLLDTELAIPKGAEWFSNIPGNIIPYHGKFLRELGYK